MGGGGGGLSCVTSLIRGVHSDVHEHMRGISPTYFLLFSIVSTISFVAAKYSNCVAKLS